MTFIEFGNVQGVITYAKINGIEKGVKKERTYITNENNVRDIYSISNNKVKLEMYLLEPFDVEIEVKDINKDKLLGSFVFKSHEGVNAFILKTKKLEKGNYYRVQINYKKENGSGSFSNGFTSKH